MSKERSDIEVVSTALLESLDRLTFEEHSKAKYKSGAKFEKHELIATGIARARNHVANFISNAEAETSCVKCWKKRRTKWRA